jgi:GntR family transcriptional regulator
VRLLAETQVINPNTVARAYQDLIRDGVLESRAGRGVFVAERRQVFSAAERKRRLGQAAENLCHEGLLSDSSLPELREVLENTWNSLQRETTQERKKK